jgi:uncharacterized membrane protein
MIQVYEDGDTSVLTLSPNLSAGWRESRMLLLMLAVPVVGIGVGWFLAGAVLILPFAGLELSALALALRHVCRQAQRKEVISIEASRVVVEHGRDQPESRQTLERPRVYLHVTYPERPLDLMELVLVDRRQRLRVGEWLNNQQREETRLALRQAGLAETSNRWWRRSP